MRRVAVLCACVLSLAGSSAAQPRVAFLAAGDFGVGGSRERALGRGMHRFEQRNAAGLLVTLGDNDYTRSSARFRANWRKSFHWASKSGVRVAGVLGNHDVEVGGGRYELRALGMPALYYARRLGEVELFLLDSNLVGDRQTRWLEQRLAASDATWKVVVLHHPPYTCGGHEGDQRVIDRWVPLFERYGVQLVLSGHDHNYQRFEPRNGVTYLVHGGGGAPLYALSACPTSYPPRARARLQHGFLYVAAFPDRLDGYAVSVSGRITDHFSIAAS